jgi:hypothetical protein
VIVFTSALVGWTVAQYSRETRPLTLARPIRLTAPLAARPAPATARSIAA